MRADCLGKAYRLARPFKGPYWIVRLFANGAEVRLISKLQAGTIHVALNRVRKCPSEIKNADPQAASMEVEGNPQPVSEPRMQTGQATVVSEQTKPALQPTTQTIERPWNNRLRP